MNDLRNVPSEFLEVFSKNEFDDKGNLYLSEIDHEKYKDDPLDPELAEFIKKMETEAV